MVRTASNLRTMFAAMILLAVLVRGLIPAGFMPGIDASGLTRFVLCTPTGVSTFLADKAQADHAKKIYAGHILQVGDKAGKTDSKPHAPCPYAPSFAGGLIAAPFMIAAQMIAVAHDTIGAPYFFSRNVKSYQSQGPPVSIAKI